MLLPPGPIKIPFLTALLITLQQTIQVKLLHFQGPLFNSITPYLVKINGNLVVSWKVKEKYNRTPQLL
jgi:hypothetical protein